MDRTWDALVFAFGFHEEPFRIVAAHPEGVWWALGVVLLSGISRGMGEAIILFLNQVKPGRMILTLLMDALFFALGFLAQVASIWVLTRLPGAHAVPLPALVAVLGLAHVPMLFSFLAALPHVGHPLQVFMSAAHLLGMVVGFGVLAETGPGSALAHVAVGWLLLQAIQGTLGRPVIRIGRSAANLASGVKLVRNPRELFRAVGRPVAAGSTPLRDWRDEWARQLEDFRRPARSEAPGPGPGAAPVPERDARKSRQRGLGMAWRTALGFLLVVVPACGILAFVGPVGAAWFGWWATLPGPVLALVNLGWVGAAALAMAGLLAPVEALGWWAGWFEEDESAPEAEAPGELARPVADAASIRRFVVYLDGVGQSNHQYLPDTEHFLATLVPELPEDIALVRGILPYTVINRPLDEDRPLSFLWRRVQRLRFLASPARLLGMMVNLRNMLIVFVSADRRYGPLYNRGMAQMVRDGLVKNGYRPGSGVPVTFLGFSGGGQISCACAPYVKRALRAPVDVISLGGVISGNANVLKLEQLYHLAGDKDTVERFGAWLFPGRWRCFPLSHWNRAMRRGNISVYSLGPAGHQLPGGILDPDLVFADGRSALRRTVDTVLSILRGEMPEEAPGMEVRRGNFVAYRTNPWVRPEAFPIGPCPDPERYVPVGEWTGRLVLPPRAKRFGGVWFEVHWAPEPHRDLIGTTVRLGWIQDAEVRRWRLAVTQDLHFSADAEHGAKFGGFVHPVRLNHWLQVDPLESLAGARPEDDMIVVLESPRVEWAGKETWLRIAAAPMEVTGRFRALVRFLGAGDGGDGYRVRHFDRSTGDFQGPEEIVRLPPGVRSPVSGCRPSVAEGIERSPCNGGGWHIWGSLGTDGRFVVQALGPRDLLRTTPQRVETGGTEAAWRWLRHDAWSRTSSVPGTVASVACPVSGGSPTAWEEGDRALVLHVFGGIGGARSESASPICFGHFSYGRADVILDPLSGEGLFEIRYHQVYAHNTDGFVAGTMHWSRYQGDRQFGWLGIRPSCDLLLRPPGWGGTGGSARTVWQRIEDQLQAMTARYRTGDGTGGTFVGPANNCAQDSNRAFFAGLRQASAELPDLLPLVRELEHALQPLGHRGPESGPEDEFLLGSTLEDEPLRNLVMGLGSWRSLLPRKASDVVARILLRHGADLFGLRTNQVGGADAEIRPIPPVTF